MLQVAACPITFVLLCDLFGSGGVQKPIKNNLFKVFLAAVVHFLKILVSSRHKSYFIS